MAEHHPTPPQPQRPPKPTSAAAATTDFLRKLHDHAPNPTHLIAFLAVLLLSGTALTAAAMGLIFFAPLVVVSSPIWVPVCTFLFVAAAGFFSVCGFGVSVVAGSSWLYKYFRGFNPPGADRVDYARSRIYDTASHVKDYAREYGGYLQSKAKDAAPGA